MANPRIAAPVKRLTALSAMGTIVISLLASPLSASTGGVVSGASQQQRAPSNPFTASFVKQLQLRDHTTIDCAVMNLATGKTYSFTTGALPHYDASIVKLDVLETILATHQSVVPSTWQPLATSMIEDSDNNATTDLWEKIDGYSALTNYNNRLGLKHTVVEKLLSVKGFPWPAWGLTTTTAADQVRLVQQIAESTGILTATARRYAATLMANVIASEDWGITSGVSQGTTVSLKNGWLPIHGYTDWTVNSIGWIHGNGHDYIAAILTDGNATMGYGQQTIATISQQFWSTQSSPQKS